MFAGGICLSLALAGGPPAVFLPWEHFTLAWMHSIEKVRWEEDYAVVRDAGGVWSLQAVESRVKGSGAGMDPPPGAVWRDGWFVHRPAAIRVDVLRLSRSDFVPDYELCTATGCHPLSHHLPSDGGTTLVQACGAGQLRTQPGSGNSG
nr:DUF1850 domain-containing protein [Tepidicella baoligensis]